MHKFLLAAAAAVLAISSLSLPTEARVETFRDSGWHFMVTNQYNASRTLIDRTPRVTSVAVYLQKKAGPRHCRASVVVYKNGKVWKWKNLQKWSRTYSRAGVWKLKPFTYDRTVKVKVNTNGRCIVGVGVK